MVSLVLFSFAIAGVLAVAVSMAQGYREQRQTVSTESAARNAMDFMADAVRGASPAVQVNTVTTSTATEMIVGPIQDVANCMVGSLKVTDVSNAPDKLDVVFASGGVVTSLATVYDGTNSTITVNDANNLADGDTLLITDGTTGHLIKVGSPNAVNQTSRIVNIVAASGCTLTLPAGGYPAGSLVIRALRASFYISTFEGVANVLLMDPGADGIDPEPLADHVEDMQLALGVDTNNDKVISAAEWGFSAGVGNLGSGNAVRALRMTLIVRSPQELVGGTAGYYRPGAENRSASTAPDKFKRRTLSTTIEIRNFGGSPQ